jgi:hypothetical protein
MRITAFVHLQAHGLAMLKGTCKLLQQLLHCLRQSRPAMAIAAHALVTADLSAACFASAELKADLLPTVLGLLQALLTLRAPPLDIDRYSTAMLLLLKTLRIDSDVPPAVFGEAIRNVAELDRVQGIFSVPELQRFRTELLCVLFDLLSAEKREAFKDEIHRCVEAAARSDAVHFFGTFVSQFLSRQSALTEEQRLALGSRLAALANDPRSVRWDLFQTEMDMFFRELALCYLSFV